MEKRNIYLTIGLGSLLAAIFNELSGSAGRPTGRWSWLFGPIFDAYGNFGISMYWLVLAAISFLMAFFARGSKG